MKLTRNLPNNVKDILLGGFAIVMLLINVAPTLAHIFIAPYPGFALNVSWVVITEVNCEERPLWCEANDAEISPGDRLLFVGDLTHDAFLADRAAVPFEGYGPGDRVYLRYEHQGQVREAWWLMPPISWADRWPRVLGMLLYLPFWTAGTVVLLFLRPRDLRWRLLAAMNYMIALWVAAGSVSTEVPLGSILFYPLTWLLLPVFLHLHLVLPVPLARNWHRYLLPGLYGASGLIALLDLLHGISPSTYAVGILLPVGGAFLLILYRLTGRVSPQERLTTRLLLAGILLAFLPGAVLILAPVLIGTPNPSFWSLVAASVALPAFPALYTYALYKRHLGDLEFRASRLLGMYSFALLFLTAYTVVYTIGVKLLPSDEGRALFALLLGLVFALGAQPVQARFQRLVGRVAYGAKHNPDEVLQTFTQRIAAAPTRDALGHLLADELAPTLFIRQSVLLLLGEQDGTEALFVRGVPGLDLRLLVKEAQQLLAEAGRYRPPDPHDRSPLAWVRLVLPLEARGEIIGIWLFGRRDPDDFYPYPDIKLLGALASQAALSVENTRLFEDTQRQLEEISSLYDIALATGAALDRDLLLQRLYDQVRRALPLDAFVVSLYDEETQAMEVALAIEEDELMTELVNLRAPLEDGGLTGWVMRHREPLLIGDLSRDPLPVKPRHKGTPARSWLGVPLIAHERLIGAMSVQSFHPDRYSSRQLRFLEILAAQVAVALENAQLFQETQRRASQQEAINAIIAAAAGATELPALLESALRPTLRALNAPFGALWVGDTCALHAQSQDTCDIVRQWLLQSTGSHLGTPIVVADITEAKESMPVQPPAALVRSGVRAMLYAPLRGHGGLWLGSERPRHWMPEEVALVEAITRQLATAVERLRLLDRVREQAQQVQRILDTVQEGILTLDARQRVVLANPSAREYLRLLAEAEVGDVLHRLGEYPVHYYLSPRPGGLPHEIIVDKPERRVFEVLPNPVPIGMAEGGWTLLIRDVTEAREIQARAQQQDRLAAVGQLAAGIAHDFNNIMAAIILYAEMVQRNPELTTRDRERLSTILQQAQRASALTRQILDFSRRGIVESHPMDLAPFLKELQKLLERTLPEGIDIKLIHEPEEFILSADPARLQQVFMNLALNARDAMPDGGELAIELSRFILAPQDTPSFTDMAPGEWLRITVSDTGTGIPEEHISRIFEPFFTTKPPGQGTGLGLAQVYGIVKQHGGFIDVESREGKGTTFILYFPALKLDGPEIIELEPSTVAQVQGQQETILLVEDDSATRTAVLETLQSLNYRVLVAVDGQQALQIFEQHQDEIDLVLSDLVMPGIGGMQLYQNLRARRPDLKLVLMTGYPTGSGTRDLLERENVIWVQKPLDSQTIARIVQKSLHGQ